MSPSAQTYARKKRIVASPMQCKKINQKSPYGRRANSDGLVFNVFFSSHASLDDRTWIVHVEGPTKVSSTYLFTIFWYHLY